MDLSLDPSVASGLTSRSQIARRVTGRWAAENLFCLACPSDELTAERPNAPVQDFTCPRCHAAYQLKGKNGRHGNVVVNSAFEQKIAAIREGRAPNYAFMDYDRDAWKVTRLFVVPGHFITESVVQRRKALASTARRAGWVGSNILLSKLPPEGRIPVISGGSAMDPGTVRRAWDRFRFLKQDGRASGGWGADVLAWVRRVQEATGETDFTLRSFYECSRDALAMEHPDNNNVEAKIRQQLQVLRDGGILEFLGRGSYRIIG